LVSEFVKAPQNTCNQQTPPPFKEKNNLNIKAKVLPANPLQMHEVAATAVASILLILPASNSSKIRHRREIHDNWPTCTHTNNQTSSIFILRSRMACIDEPKKTRMNEKLQRTKTKGDN